MNNNNKSDTTHFVQSICVWCAMRGAAFSEICKLIIAPSLGSVFTHRHPQNVSTFVAFQLNYEHICNMHRRRQRRRRGSERASDDGRVTFAIHIQYVFTCRVWSMLFLCDFCFSVFSLYGWLVRFVQLKWKENVNNSMMQWNMVHAMAFFAFSLTCV